MDIDDLDANRLCNVVYSTLIADAGAGADRTAVREHLDSTLARASKPPKGTPRDKMARRGGISAEQAKKMAADLESYDSKIQGGRLVGGE